MHTQDMEERDSRNARWLIVFVLISLLVHALLALAIILASIYLPAPKIDLMPLTSPTVNLTLMPQPVQPPPMKRPFMPTTPQANAPHKDTLIESDNDTQVASHSKTDRADSVMPDVVSKREHTSQLEDSPNSPSTQKPQSSSAPPTPKQAQPKQQQTPPQPKQPQPQPQKTPPQQAQPTQNPSPPNPAKTPAPNPKPAPFDPNGLPVLPAINAPTIAPQIPITADQATVPPPILQALASNLQGRAGITGDVSPKAMKTELGAYKTKFYRAVGARWYGKVNDQLQILPVGIVRVQYTIHSDGRVEYKVLDGGNGTMELLLSISVNSILEVSPFDPFTDSMRKELAEQQGGNGDSYTDEFSFSIYGGGGL